MNALTAAHSHLTQRDSVVGDGLRDPGHRSALYTRATAEAGVRPGQDLLRAILRIAPGSRQELGLLGRVEPLELRNGAAQPDRAAGDVDKVKGNEPAQPLAASRLDNQMGDRASD